MNISIFRIWFISFQTT